MKRYVQFIFTMLSFFLTTALGLDLKIIYPTANGILKSFTIDSSLIWVKSVSKVELYIDDVKLGERTQPPYEFSLTDADGKLRWKFRADGVTNSSPAISSDGTIYVGSDDSYMYAITHDGELKWKFKTNASVVSSPVIGTDGTIYVGNSDKHLYAILPDGNLKWKLKMNDVITSSPSIGADGTIYVGSYDGHLYAITPDGEIKWKFSTSMAVSSSPAIGTDGTVYVGSYDSYLYAITFDGELKWKFKTDWVITSSPAIGSDGTIYITSWDRYLYAISPEGELKWKFESGGYIDSSPVIDSNGNVYFGSSDDYLYAVSSNGKLIWKAKLDDDILSSVLVGADGTIYVGGKDSFIYAFTTDGILKWKYKVGGSIISSPTLGLNGILYVGAHDGYLYAIQTSSFGLTNSSWPKFKGDVRNVGRIGEAFGVVQDYLILKAVIYDELENKQSITVELKVRNTEQSWIDESSTNNSMLVEQEDIDDKIEELNVELSENEELIPESSETVMETSTLLQSIIEDKSPPSLWIKNLKDGDIVGKQVRVDVEVKDDNEIERVELYANGYKITEKFSEPYVFEFNVEEFKNNIFQWSQTSKEYKELWRIEIGSTIASALAISEDGTLYFGSNDKQLYALTPKGNVKWSLKTNGFISSAPVIGKNGEVYVASSDSYLYALMPDGKLKWKFKTNDDVVSSPAIGADGTIYFGSNDNYLYALTPDGKLKWRFKTNNDVVSSPAIGADGTIYFGSNDNYLYALTPDGKLLWKFSTSKSVTSSPLIGSDGVIYFGSNDGYLYAVLPSGKLEWKFGVNGSVVSSPTIDNNGLLYFADTRGTIYAIQTTSFGLAESFWPKFKRSLSNNASALEPLEFTNVSIPRELVLTIVAYDKAGNMNECTVNLEVDALPPKINVMSLKDGDVVKGTINIKVMTYDANGIDSIEGYFGIDKIEPKPDDSDGTYLFTVDTDNYAEGTHKFRVFVFDKYGNEAERTINLVVDRTPPEVTVENIREKSLIKNKGVIKVTAEDSNGIAKIEFFLDNRKIDEKLSLPYIFNYTYYHSHSVVIKQSLNYEENKLIWKFQTNRDITASPTIGQDGTIYVASWDKYLYAIAPNGLLEMRFELGDFAFSTPAIGVDGTIYIGSWDKNLYAIRPDGNLLWKFEAGERIFSSPAIGPDGTIYFCSLDGNLYALNPSGKLKWKFQAKDWIFSSPAVGPDGSIYFGSRDGSLYSVSPDGQLNWRFETQRGISSSPAIGFDGTIYFGSDDGFLYAVSFNGRLIWKFETEAPIFSSPSVGPDGTIYVGSTDNCLYAITQDGELKWKFKTRDWVLSSPVVGGDGTVYVGSLDGNLYAIAADGRMKWAFQTGSGIASSPVIAENGVIYFGSYDGYLYAVQTNSPGLAVSPWTSFRGNSTRNGMHNRSYIPKEVPVTLKAIAYDNAENVKEIEISVLVEPGITEITVPIFTNSWGYPREIVSLTPNSTMEKGLRKLRPEFRIFVEKFIETCRDSGINVSVYYTYRTKEEQYALYLQGRAPLEEVNETRAQVGLPPIKDSENRIVSNLLNSAHNHGLAADFVPIVDGQAVWNDYNLWNKCGQIALDLGLDWGGSWKDFPDHPHLQMKNWRKYVK